MDPLDIEREQWIRESKKYAVKIDERPGKVTVRFTHRPLTLSTEMEKMQDFALDNGLVFPIPGLDDPDTNPAPNTQSICDYTWHFNYIMLMPVLSGICEYDECVNGGENFYIDHESPPVCAETLARYCHHKIAADGARIMAILKPLPVEIAEGTEPQRRARFDTVIASDKESTAIEESIFADLTLSDVLFMCRLANYLGMDELMDMCIVRTNTMCMMPFDMSYKRYHMGIAVTGINRMPDGSLVPLYTTASKAHVRAFATAHGIKLRHDTNDGDGGVSILEDMSTVS
jgi:hypothetical protein